MKSAIVGYTGFVGGNLCLQRHFDFKFNSTNADAMMGQHFDFLVISAAPAVKWWANQNPQKDWDSIASLIRRLEHVRASRVLLVSTVDVYPKPEHVDEQTKISGKDCHPYGKHRLMLEEFVHDRFATQILRLPGLFGAGLKKNIIYDFINNNELEKIDSRGQFQFYDLSHLNSDIERLMATEVRLLNMTSEPIRASDVARVVLDCDWVNEPVGSRPARYDVRSCFADRFGGRGGYLYSREQVLDDLRQFVRKAKVA